MVNKALSYSALVAAVLLAANVIEQLSAAQPPEVPICENWDKVETILQNRGLMRVLKILKRSEPDVKIVPFVPELRSYRSFNASLPIKVIIPGYRTEENERWVVAAKDKWFKLGDYNIFGVFWPKHNHGSYGEALYWTPQIAAHIVHQLALKLAGEGVRLCSDSVTERMHLIGHSMGAHISALVGLLLDGRVERITGLDPAGPSYDKIDSVARLNPSSARFVEVIHTNSGKIHAMYAAGILAYASDKANAVTNKIFGKDLMRVPELLRPWFGIGFNIGHVDYYANDGRQQPGCENEDVNICNHGRATKLYQSLLDFEYNRRTSGGIRLMALERDKFPSRSAAFAMDLLKPTEEYLHELERTYGRAFDRSPDSSNLALQFDTLAEPPYFQHHLAIDLHFHTEARQNQTLSITLSYLHSAPDRIYRQIEGTKSLSVLAPMHSPESVQTLLKFLARKQVGYSFKYNDLVSNIFPVRISISTGNKRARSKRSVSDKLQPRRSILGSIWGGIKGLATKLSEAGNRVMGRSKDEPQQSNSGIQQHGPQQQQQQHYQESTQSNQGLTVDDISNVFKVNLITDSDIKVVALYIRDDESYIIWTITTERT